MNTSSTWKWCIPCNTWADLEFYEDWKFDNATLVKAQGAVPVAKNEILIILGTFWPHFSFQFFKGGWGVQPLQHSPPPPFFNLPMKNTCILMISGVTHIFLFNGAAEARYWCHFHCVLSLHFTLMLYIMSLVFVFLPC